MSEDIITCPRDDFMRMQGQIVEEWDDPPSSQLAPLVSIVRRGLGEELGADVACGLVNIVIEHVDGQPVNVGTMWKAERAAASLLQTLGIQLVPLCYFVVECDYPEPGRKRVVRCRARFYCVKPSRLC